MPEVAYLLFAYLTIGSTGLIFDMTESEASSLSVHSIGEFALAVPRLAEGEHFFKSFGLSVTNEANHLALRTPAGTHRWGRLVEGKRKFLKYISFLCFEHDLPRFKSHFERSHIKLVDPPPEANRGGLWIQGHDDLLIEVRVGPKTSPSEISEIPPPEHQAGVRNAPYRRSVTDVPVRRLSHILLFTPDVNQAITFYSTALGLRLSDRCGDIVGFLHAPHGSDHHILAFAKSDKPGLHHMAWDVPSIDHVGLGALAMAERGYKKSWGTGRHVLGSNYFNYIQDPWGSWIEYSCGIDFIPAGSHWVGKDQPIEEGFYLWGPDVPSDFTVNFENSNGL